jgi:hypothetical protein
LAIAGQAVAGDYATASVTSLTASKNAVLISRDGHYQPLLSTSGVVRKNDRVVVLQGGRASVTYPDGCKVELKSGTMATIGAVSPCAGAGTAFQPVDVNLPLVGPTPLAGAVIGGAAAVGLGVVIAGASGAFNSTPSSP